MRYNNSRLGKSNKVMLRIDNQDNQDIDAIEIFKPNKGGSCSPVKLFEHSDINQEKNKIAKATKNKYTKVTSLVMVSLIIIVLLIIAIAVKEFMR